jgi:hypothetical protein
MPKTFKIGDHVRWNSEAGRVSGVIIKKITSDTSAIFTMFASHNSPYKSAGTRIVQPASRT